MNIKQYTILVYYRKYFWLMACIVISVIITDIIRTIANSGVMNVGSFAYFSALLKYISLSIIAYYAYNFKKYTTVPSSTKNIFYCWLFWNIFNIIRGFFLADGYFDLKFLLLDSFAFSMISVVFYIGNNIFLTRGLFNFYLKWIFTFGFLIIPLAFLTNNQLYARLMIPNGFFILFTPYLKKKWILLIFVVAFTSIITALDFRTNMIKTSIPILLLSLYYFRNIFRQGWIRLAHIVFFLAPIVLLILGLIGKFNPFEELSSNEGVVLKDAQGSEENVMGDTRTFLYQELLSDIPDVPTLIFGKSASGSYKSEWFHMEKRYAAEINILNILLYHGIIGVIIYFLLLYKVSLMAIKNSNNTLSKMLGLVIASRWLLSFIEEFTRYDLNFFFFWLIMGLISSSSFRALSDKQLKDYFNF